MRIKLTKLITKRQLVWVAGSNWFITLMATTLGVLLALYLNNLNTKSIVEKNKAYAISNLEEELINNEKELHEELSNDSLLTFFKRLSKIDNKISNKLTSDSKTIKNIVK